MKRSPFLFQILFMHGEYQQSSTPCSVTAVSHNAQNSNTDMTAPSRPPTHPVTTNSWGIQEGGRMSAEQRASTVSQFECACKYWNSEDFKSQIIVVG